VDLIALEIDHLVNARIEATQREESLERIAADPSDERVMHLEHVLPLILVHVLLTEYSSTAPFERER
jgi:hypothetical protein